MPSLMSMASPQDPNQDFLAQYMNAQNQNPPQPPPMTMTPWSAIQRSPASTAASSPAAPSLPQQAKDMVEKAKDAAAGQAVGASPQTKAAAQGAGLFKGSKVNSRIPTDPAQFDKDSNEVIASKLLQPQEDATNNLQNLYDQLNRIQLANSNSWARPLAALSDSVTGSKMLQSDNSVSPQQIAQQMAAQGDELAKRKQDEAKDRVQLLSAFLKAPTGSVTNVYGNPSNTATPQDQYWKLADNALNSVRGDRTLNQAKMNHLLSQNVDALVNDPRFGGDLNKMTPQQSALLRDEIVKMATGGAATIAAEHNIDPDTIKSSLAAFREKVMNSQVGGDAGDFNKSFVDYAHGLDRVATKSVQSKMSQVLSPFKSKLADSDYQSFNKNYVQDPFGENNLNPGAATPGSAPDLASLAAAEIAKRAKAKK